MAKQESTRVRAARQKANEIRREQERAQRRRRVLVQAGVIVGAVAVIGAVVTAVTFATRGAATVNAPDSAATVAIDESDIRLDVTGDRVRVGADDATVTLSIFEDFSCPHCQAYEAEVGDTLTELIATGDVAVEFHPIRIVTNYGNRAGSAATCVAVGAPERWLDVRSELFAIHDATTDGWGNDRFREHLAAQGIDDDDVLECVSEGRYATWIDQNTAAALEAGVSSTPTLLIDGEPAETLGATQLRTAVDEILAGS